MTLIQRFLTGCYKVKRMKSGTYVNGFYVPGCQEEIEMMGSLQPMSPRDLKQPEEGDRLKEWFNFYTDTPLFPDNTRKLAKSAIVYINGESYRVMSTEIWQGLLNIPYYKSVLAREPEQ